MLYLRPDMKKFFLLIPAVIVLFSACSRGVTVSTPDGTKVRVTAVNDRIIRVSAVPDGQRFPKEESLSVIAQRRYSGARIARSGSEVTLSTPEVTARINAADGRVSFEDASGNVYTAEDRRSFEPYSEGGYTVRQVFSSPDSEGFYGLGQHQADEWNRKGGNEELYQYNTKISIPFIVSSRNYGILWDSYSFCRWGDPRDYAQLGDVFTLTDAEGNPGALTGVYTAADGSVLKRRETALAQEYLRTPQCDVVKGAPEGFDFNGSSVCYDGCLEAPESGIYRFYIYYAGYTKVFIDGAQVTPEIWRTAWNPNGRKFECRLEAGRKTPIHIDWKPDGGVSYCALKVLSPVDPEEQAKMSWWGEMQDCIDYYFIAGENIDGVISGYRTLTGKAQIMPEWAMGYWQSRERYSRQDEVLETLAEFRRRGIPVDNIVQDWQYWKDDAWGSHEFDETRYPDPKAMVDSIHAMGGRFMISVWPKFYEGTQHFDELDSRGWIYRTAIDENVIDWLGYRQSFYDAYAPGARKLFWQQMQDHLWPIGVDAWWMDASEPNIHDCTDMPYRKRLCGPTALGPSSKYFNAYALVNAQAIYEGQRAVAPDQRVFLLTRNGFSGLQRYSTASWSGDIGTRWEDMKAQISAGLSFSISGIPYWTQDVGGFSVENRYMAAQGLYNAAGVVNADLEEWRELQARWHEWGIFCPLYRAHGQYPFREPWNIAPEGDPAYEAIVAADRQRYALMPYIYTLASRTWFDDYTIMRPLVMDFTSDAVAREVSDEFMFGDALLVCPVYEYGARSREVYLPEGGWTEIHTGQRYEGPCHIEASAPFDHIPVFGRDGRMVVESPVVSSTAQKVPQLAVTVYGGSDASFALYEDDGVSYGYERGEYSRIPMAWDASRRCFVLGEREGSFPGMMAERDVRVRIVLPDEVCEKAVEYDGEAVEIEF